MVEPLLKGMSNDDLNQRYANSYVLYNKKVHYISGFIIGSKGQPILVGTNHRGRDTNLSLEFDWQLLDTSRPESKWYEWAGALMHLSYQPRRQYVRGICRNNTVLWTPRGGHAIHHDVVTALYDPEVRTYGYTPAQVLDAISSILSKQMAMINNMLYYRSLYIGEKRDNKLFLNNPSYFQDFKDIGLGGITEYDVKEQKNKMVDQGGGGMGLADLANRIDGDWNTENVAFAEMLRQRNETRRQDEVAIQHEEALNRALGIAAPPPPHAAARITRADTREARGRIFG